VFQPFSGCPPCSYISYRFPHSRYLFLTYIYLGICWTTIATQRGNPRCLAMTPIFLLQCRISPQHASPPSYGHETRPMHSPTSLSLLNAISGCLPLMLPRFPRHPSPTSTG